MHCHGYGFDTVITVSRTVTQNSNVRGKITVLLQLLSVITRVIVQLHYLSMVMIK